MKKAPVVIVVGAGLSGLTCAVKLHEEGVPILVLESSDRIGGRVATDRYEAYLMDRGFQVLLTGYPEARQVLNYPALNLHSFYPGLMIWWKGKFHKFVLPFSHPIEALEAVRSPIGTWQDKVQLIKYRRHLLNTDIDMILQKRQRTVLELLKEEGFSQTFIDRFWRPLCAAFLLEREMETSSRVFELIVRSYFSGDATLPVSGMGAIPAQLADRLPKGSIRFNAPVTAIQDGILSLPQGETLATQVIVIATDAVSSTKLLADPVPPPAFRTVTCLYYETKRAPVEKPFLLLNGEDDGLVSTVCVPSLVSSSYAGERHHLISVSVLEDTTEEEEHELEHKVREHMRLWFPENVNSWRYLKYYRINQALPLQTADELAQPRTIHVRPGIYRCGDYMSIASINGAIESGRHAAEAVLQELKSRV